MKICNELVLSSLLLIGLMAGCRNEPSDPTPAEKPDQTKTIGTQGGIITIDQATTITFPSGSFKADATVSITKSQNNADLRTLFDEMAAPLYGVEKRADYFLKIATNGKRPQRTVSVRLDVPPTLQSQLKEGLGFEVFALLNQSVAEETMLNFDVVPSRWDAASRTLVVDLPAYYFDYQDNGSRYEATLTIGLVPGQNKAGRVAADECNGLYVSCPLTTCEQTSAFNPQRAHPTLKDDQGNPILRPHLGVDFRANKTQVFAAVDGTIKAARTQRNAKGDITGWGNYMILEHVNASGQRFATLYAHLDEFKKTAGAVKEGELIAVSGNSGTSEAPHLHFEYIVNANIADKNARIDPAPLINETSVRLLAATARQIGVNDCSSGSRSSWNVAFDYRDPKFSIDSKATLTFQDVEPVVNSPYTVNAGLLKTANGLVNSPTFCARYGELGYFKVKVYMTLGNGVRSNCIYFYLRRQGNAAREAITDAKTAGPVGTNM